MTEVRIVTSGLGRFVADIDDPSQAFIIRMEITFSWSRAPEVVGLGLMAREISDPPITGAALRGIKVATYRDMAIKKARPWVALHLAELTGRLPEPAVGPVTHRQGRRLDDAFLQTVADIYRESEHAPVERVMERLHGARSSAGRWVMLARKRGFLGPAIGTRAGEAR